MEVKEENKWLTFGQGFLTVFSVLLWKRGLFHTTEN